MRSTRAASRLLLALYVILAALVSSGNAQWEDGGMDPREEEFFAARMNQNQGRRDLYQEPARCVACLVLSVRISMCSGCGL
jgi:hypothetical protein